MSDGATLLSVPMLYADLDGTVRHGLDELGRFVNGPDDVVVFPEAVAQLHRWREAGGRVIGVSNQGGIALGHLTVQACADAMWRTQELAEQTFDLISYCPHHPDAPSPTERRCWCRKPRPGLAIEATMHLEQVFTDEHYPRDLALFVGDRPEDRACAEQLNVDFLDAAAWRAGEWSPAVVPAAD